MKQFCKHYFHCLLWLLLSEILGLVLAFSFAIINTKWSPYVSLVCGILTHVLLMGSAAQTLAKRDAAQYRINGKRRPAGMPPLLGLATALPFWLLYLLLQMQADSSLMLNVFLLLNAPYLQIHRLLLDGVEPFSAVNSTRQLLMALPPILTALSVWIGYELHYIPAVAEQDAKQPNP